MASGGVSYDKIKFIGMFVGSAVTGVILVLLAVFNASTELAIVQEISAMHDLMQDRLEKTGTSRQAHITEQAMHSLAENLSTKHYRVLPVFAEPQNPDELEWQWDGLRVSWADIQQSRVGAQGGYFHRGGHVYTWSLLAPAGHRRLLVLHRHEPLAPRLLFSVYQNRLIVPAAFTIWMTVWVSLILNGLLTRLQAQKDAVERMAWHDPLTGLPNRNLLFKTLEDWVERARTERFSFVLAVVDLDGFKEVNDAHGHDVGDALLQQVARRFEHAVRRNDMVARMGGDEFILLFPDMTIEACEEVCAGIVRDLCAEYWVQGHPVRVSASVGVARFPEDAREIVELIRQADTAMYMAKRSGGGVVWYSRSDSGLGLENTAH